MYSASSSGRLAADGCVREREPQAGHALLERLVVHEVGKRVDDDADGRNSVVRFNFSNVADDRRRTGASMAYGHHHQAIYGLNLPPEFRVVPAVGAPA